MKPIKEPTEDLFEYSSKSRKYTFINFRGKKQIFLLGEDEYLLHEKCPICEVNRIVWHGEIDSIIVCPSCGRKIEKTKEYKSLRESLKNSFFEREQELKKLKKNLERDKAFLKFIEHKVSEQKYYQEKYLD